MPTAMQCPPPCPAPLPTKTPDKAPARRRPRPRRNAILAAQRAETGRPAAQNGPFRMTERPVSHHAGCQPLTHSGKHCDISLHKRNRRACRGCPCLQPLTHKCLTPASVPPALRHTQYAGHQRALRLYLYHSLPPQFPIFSNSPASSSYLVNSRAHISASSPARWCCP